MEREKKFAVITGASRGLGRCYALELAERGINTILVSLPGENLASVAHEASLRSVESYVYETDITRKENIIELCRSINDTYDVFMLINNAGVGGTQRFTACGTDYLDTIIRLNITACTMMTHQLLPNLLRQQEAYVLNVSSMASFSPTGYKTVYSASKRFIQHFSRGLYEELRNTGVFVSVVHPGPMRTNPETSARIEIQGAFAKVLIQSPEYVARKSVTRLFRRHTLILLGLPNKLSRVLMGIIPVRIRLPLMTKVISRELQIKPHNS